MDMMYTGILREEKLKELKPQKKNKKTTNWQYIANCVLSALIFKRSKPFTEGDFIRIRLIITAAFVRLGNQNLSKHFVDSKHCR